MWKGWAPAASHSTNRLFFPPIVKPHLECLAQEGGMQKTGTLEYTTLGNSGSTQRDRGTFGVTQVKNRMDKMAAKTFARRAFRGAVLCALALAIAGCANKEATGPDSNLLNGKGGPITPGSQRDFAVNVGDIVYFSSDSTDLTPESQATLQKQSRWLAQYPQFTVTVEGHADERGTREYNIALGARRATAVRNFLAQNGVQAARLRTVSYGKERPVAVCNDISCWSQNRRAQTVLNSRAGT